MRPFRIGDRVKTLADDGRWLRGEIVALGTVKSSIKSVRVRWDDGREHDEFPFGLIREETVNAGE